MHYMLTLMREFLKTLAKSGFNSYEHCMLQCEVLIFLEDDCDC